jgi:hypothetical protein
VSDTDLRDERVAKALDAVVGDLHPTATPDRVMRRGQWRRAGRLTASFATVAAFLVGAVWAIAVVSGERPTPIARGAVPFTSSDVPWTFEHPPGWDVEITRVAHPDLHANLLRTTIANGPLPEGTGRHGPNGAGNTELTSALGEEGVVVQVDRSWTNQGSLGAGTERPRGPSAFFEDVQSPGWTSRDRVRCRATLCFKVTEWFGPAASPGDVAAAAAMAGSVRVADIERWTETDGRSTTLHDLDDRYSVTFPASWFVSDEPVNDWVSSPFEILALATYPLRPGGEAVTDFQLPSNAIEDLGPNDIFVWVNDGGDGEGFPERPDRLGPSEPCEDWTRLCPEPGGRRLGLPGLRAWWLGFRHAGRGIYAFVGMGEEAYADPTRQQVAWDILNSLRFLPR